MTFPLRSPLFALLCCAAFNVQAGTPASAPVTPSTTAADSGCCHHYADSPIGVMFDHSHSAGGLMVGYRYFRSDYSGLQKNGDGISTHDVFEEGFMASPETMTMDMHMLEIMYAPTDWLTFMVMPMYMEMDMTMKMGGSHAEEGQSEHSMAGEGHSSAAHGGTHSHGTRGWGDTNVSAIFKVWSVEHHQLLATLGLSLPTGSVDQKVNGKFTHYMMQLGSGTWDLTPSLTYKGHSGRVFWGAQYLAAIRLEERNESGYRLGNVHQGSTWAGVDICDWANITGRAVYRHEGQIRHHYEGAHNHSSPPDLQGNYGGNTLDLGVGLNVVIPKGMLKGNRFSIEALFPVEQDLNGIQLEREFTLVAGWQWSF